VIERELNRARCVVVAWSAKSIASPWVRLEANRARERRNIVPVRLDSVPVPAEFAIFQAFDMTGTPSDEMLARLADGVAAQLHRRTRRRVAAIAGLAAATLITIGALSCAFTGACGLWSVSFSSPIPQTSFAVVATDINVGDESVRPLLEAFVDDVRRNLRRAAIGKVSSRAETSALPSNVSPLDIGKRLRVRWLLALSIRGSKDRLRVLVELVDTSTGYLFDDWTAASSVNSLSSLNASLIRGVANRFVDDVSEVQITSNEPSEAYTLYLQGRAALREGSDSVQIGEAETIFQSILERWPRYAPAEASLCQIHLLRYERTRAPTEFAAGEGHCNRALAIDPESGDAAVALGQLYSHEGRYELARTSFSRALAESETTADARMGLGRVAAAEGRNEEAERQFRLAVDAEPAYWRTYTALGNFLFQIGRAPEALAEHERAAALAAHDGVALNNIGAALFLSGQMEAAIGAWERALNLASQAPTYSNLGAAYYLLGNYAKAIEMYERSIALSGDDYRAWSNLGDARSLAGDPRASDAYEAAVRLIEAELKMKPSDANLRVGLAAARAALGETALARSELIRAEADATNADWEFHYVAAIVESRLGDSVAAEKRIEQTLKAGYPKVLLDLEPAFYISAGRSKDES
jgi:tetratricopeptide (TPR) repeat protein/TolB-like protein